MTDVSLHPQNDRIGDEGLRGMMEYLNYYRRPPVYVPLEDAIQHESPCCPRLTGSYRMMCAEEALYACGERRCQVCAGQRHRVDFATGETGEVS